MYVVGDRTRKGHADHVGDLVQPVGVPGHFVLAVGARLEHTDLDQVAAGETVRDVRRAGLSSDGPVAVAEDVCEGFSGGGRGVDLSVPEPSHSDLRALVERVRRSLLEAEVNLGLLEMQASV